LKSDLKTFEDTEYANTKSAKYQERTQLYSSGMEPVFVVFMKAIPL
jgi:hypothetical protein